MQVLILAIAASDTVRQIIKAIATTELDQALCMPTIILSA